MIHTVDPMREGEVDPVKFRNEMMQSLDVPSLLLVANGTPNENGDTNANNNKKIDADVKRDGSNGNIPSIHVTQVIISVSLSLLYTIMSFCSLSLLIEA
jgi:hypothetical protein